MASDDSHGNVSTMAAQEPHADPELLPLPASPMEARNTEEFANIFARFVRLARSPGLFRSLTPRGSNVFVMNVRLGGEFPGAGGVGADSGFVGVPASGDAMAALPETTVGEGGAGEEEEECAVCLEGYAAGDTVRTMPCSHGFHGHCILRWLAASRLCPLCRFALQAEAGTG
ncbi:E3 ubiquitin-protein ligase CIP8-like [Panicum virgatum]|uniref:RING-type domain-containing protein n=1 Tax=Panicum virgatum TaxID=38727 RepID=A0A8T0P6D4_PANVG|nr:E3 ubiquitin-protein ligase CIP8-like [Panicum virgatum]KAG2555742.1 hypothetical protein PVAP13_8NG027500 [Panicum virgatum]